MPRYYVREFYVENILEKNSRLSPSCIKAKRFLLRKDDTNEY